MQSEWLSLYLALAQNGSLTDTAKQFEMSSQILSRKIHHLEAELAVELFSRINHQWVLTAAGELFLETAPELLQTLYQIESLSTQFHDERLSVAWSGSWGIHFLPDILKDVLGTHFSQISSHSLPLLESLELLQSNRLDLYLGTYAIDQNRELSHVCGAIAEIDLLVGPASPFVILGQARGPVNWNELTYISMENLSFKTQIWDEEKHLRRIQVLGAISVNDALELCLHSDLALYLPQRFARGYLDSGELSVLCEAPDLHTITPYFMFNQRSLARQAVAIRSLLAQHGFNSV